MCAFKLVGSGDPEDTMDGKEYQKFLDRQRVEERYGPDAPVHDNLLRFRIRERLKKRQIAELMGVTTRTYYAYEKGTRSIPSDALVKLATQTRADLNEILMGRPESNQAQVMRSGLEDMKILDGLLQSNYPELDEKDRHKVTRRIVTTDWGNLPRMHPEVIRRAVAQTTMYRSEPLELPAPPLFEDFGGRQEDYEQALKGWYQLVDDNFGKPL